jgi:hypothetical protein
MRELILNKYNKDDSTIGIKNQGKSLKIIKINNLRQKSRWRR